MIRVLLSIYPKAWKRRYGAEYEALLSDCRLAPLDVLNVLAHALGLRARAHSAGLLQCALLCVVALAETRAVLRGFTVNIFWMPHDWESLGLLVVVVTGLAAVVYLSIAALARFGMRKVGARTSRIVSRTSGTAGA